MRLIIETMETASLSKTGYETPSDDKRKTLSFYGSIFEEAIRDPVETVVVNFARSVSTWTLSPATWRQESADLCILQPPDIDDIDIAPLREKTSMRFSRSVRLTAKWRKYRDIVLRRHSIAAASR